MEGNAATGRLSPHRLAGYLAKYVTKSLADFGISARRLSGEAIAELDITEHIRAILTTINALAKAAGQGMDTLTGIGRWLHTLGYRGHITTKSRRYSTTMGALRTIRSTWTRQHATNSTASQQDPDHAMCTEYGAMAGGEQLWWEFDRAGHATPGDRTLVITAALRHIHTRRTALAEIQALRAVRPPGGGDG